MKAISKETLRRITQEFPTVKLSDEQLEDIVTPKHGIISSFQKILHEIEKLQAIDLGEIGPNGTVTNAELHDEKH